MATLTEREVLRRSKTNSFSEVKRLQCWGMNLSEINVLETATSLEILNLSCNRLKAITPLKHCKDKIQSLGCNLQQLYLRKNQITDKSELNHLKDLANLKALWLSGNPISSSPNYRNTVIGMLPQLHQLDETEREMALSEINRHSDEQSRVCTAILSLLPLLDHASLSTVNTAVQSLMKED